MNSNWNPDQIAAAWRFAARAHEGQRLLLPQPTTTLPYLTHIGAVALEVMWACSQTPHTNGTLAVSCAILHDTVEDTEITIEALREKFGRPVAEGVLALTKNKSLPDKKSQMEDSLGRIRHQPAEIWMVKMADRIANLAEPPAGWDRFKRKQYQVEARLIHTALKDAHEGLAGRLQAKIDGYSRYF